MISTSISSFTPSSSPGLGTVGQPDIAFKLAWHRTTIEHGLLISQIESFRVISSENTTERDDWSRKLNGGGGILSGQPKGTATVCGRRKCIDFPVSELTFD
jgi:hypothetical protein